jgi:hypothetical protein
MRTLILLLTPLLMAPDCGGSDPSFGPGGSPSGSDPDEDPEPEDTDPGGDGGITECEPEYTTIEVSCSEQPKQDVWHIYVAITATCSWVDVHFDGTSYGGQVTGSEGVFEGDLEYTGMACDQPHTIDFECLYMLDNYDCSYEYTP